MKHWMSYVARSFRSAGVVMLVGSLACPLQALPMPVTEILPGDTELPPDDGPPGGGGGGAPGLRLGMTWAVLGQTDGYAHVGGDASTNAYAGDTTVDTFLPMLCLLVDGREAPAGLDFDFYNGWARGAVQATPAIAGAALETAAQADEICAETFGAGWRLAEFHDGRYGADFSSVGGWSFWAAGALPAGTRFWVAINDQPANPWNSAGEMPTTLALPKFVESEAPVPDQYLAMFPEATPESEVEALATGVAAAYGVSVLDVFTSAQGFSFNGTEAQARAMSADARVESVEQDSYGQPTEEWHRDRVDQRFLPLNDVFVAPLPEGANTNIYVLDTGFRRSHQEFGGRARQDADFIRFLGSRDDCNGHGTAVGSVAGGATLGIAPRANLISIRIAGCRGNAYNPLISVFSSTIVAGLDWVARYHIKPAVANVSYGFPPGFWRRWLRLPTPMDRAVTRAVRAGVTVVVSAGNENKNADRSSPARSRDAISVSATDWTDTRASFANYGKVELFAPGVSLRTAAHTGDADYLTRSGTSFSAPIVAGAAALYLANHPGASPAQVRSVLESTATAGIVNNPGPGSANRLVFVGALGGSAAHRGMTWTVLETRPGGVVRVGADGATNPYAGDTLPSTVLPVLCLNVTGAGVPAGITPSFYAGWARGDVRQSTPLSGTLLTSRAAADAFCAAQFGFGWRMAEFHDGRYGPGLTLVGGWSFWGYGFLPGGGARFWTAINDQPANPWN